MSKKSYCYYCGIELKSGKNGNRTKEHVPPKMLFRAFTCDSITVSSCPAHNTGRSGQDQAIVAGFMKALDSGNYPLSHNVATAINYEKNKSTFETTKNTAQRRNFLKNPPANLANLPEVAYITFGTNDWIKEITAGLLYSATSKFDPKINWSDALILSPHWYSGTAHGYNVNDAIRLIAEKYEQVANWEQLNWLSGWSAYPKPYPSDIYRFYVAFEKPILFKHIFFNSFTWYVGFECGEGTRKLLGHKVLEINGL